MRTEGQFVEDGCPREIRKEVKMTDGSEAPLHPRPRLTRERWIDLNGPWQFAYDDADTGLDGRWQDHPEKFDRAITVPFPPEARLSGINDKGFHPYLWYLSLIHI